MAIERNLSRSKTETKQEAPNAYTKINSIEFRVGTNEEVWIHLHTFVDSVARNTEKACSINKESVIAKLDDFIVYGQPIAFTSSEIKSAGYRFIKQWKNEQGEQPYIGIDV